MSYNRALAQTLFHLFNVAWIGMIVLSVIAGFFLLFSPAISGATYGTSFSIKLEPQTHTATVAGEVMQVEIGNLSGDIRLENYPVSLPYQLLGLLTGFVWLFGVVFVLYQFRMLFKTFATRNPLDEKSVYRFRIIGWVFIVGNLFTVVGNEVSQRLLHSLVTDIEGVSWYMEYRLFALGDYTWLFAGLVLLALAELFRYAISVQSERDTLQQETELLA